jgi:3-dehydroquinate synthase
MELTVNLAQRSYPVFIDAQESFPQMLASRLAGRRFALVTNTTLADLYADLIAQWRAETGLQVYTIPDGEQFKTVATWQSVIDALLNNRCDRATVVIAFGGGVVGDIAGFAAACCLRGLDCIQVPTTLLAMVDSSVGGKTGVDHPRGKNLIGAFHQPRIVWIDTRYLTTLPAKEFNAGYAEIFKYGFIGGRDMFDFIEHNHTAILRHDRVIVGEAIRRSVAIKAAVVALDEFETSGQRALLNFGHTFGHALEKCFGFGGLLHGEAIWWGMACAIDLACRTDMISPSAQPLFERARTLLLRPSLPGSVDTSALYDAMFSDKKTMSGALRFVLPTEPGVSVVAASIDPTAVRQTLNAIFG